MGSEIPRAAWIRCRKCLPGGMSKEAFFEDLERYVERISPDERVSEESYWKRLEICRACGQLQEGMCRICGCYVQLRAALKVKGCPEVHPRWTAQLTPSVDDNPQRADVV